MTNYKVFRYDIASGTQDGFKNEDILLPSDHKGSIHHPHKSIVDISCIHLAREVTLSSDRLLVTHSSDFCNGIYILYSFR